MVKFEDRLDNMKLAQGKKKTNTEAFFREWSSLAYSHLILLTIKKVH